MRGIFIHRCKGGAWREGQCSRGGAVAKGLIRTTVLDPLWIAQYSLIPIQLHYAMKDEIAFSFRKIISYF